MSKDKNNLTGLTAIINSIMGQDVVSDDQLSEIMKGAQKANEEGGMMAVMEYIMKITQSEGIDMDELMQFADNIKNDPMSGFDILRQNKDK